MKLVMPHKMTTNFKNHTYFFEDHYFLMKISTEKLEILA